MEVEYFPEGGSITDMVIRLFDSHFVGVSVTRAFKYHGDYSTEDAVRLLNKKLNGEVFFYIFKIILCSFKILLDPFPKCALNASGLSIVITKLICVPCQHDSKLLAVVILERVWYLFEQQSLLGQQQKRQNMIFAVYKISPNVAKYFCLCVCNFCTPRQGDSTKWPQTYIKSKRSVSLFTKKQNEQRQLIIGNKQNCKSFHCFHFIDLK